MSVTRAGAAISPSATATSTVPENVRADRYSLRLEPHCCRACFGRIASAPIDDFGDRRYLCTVCGLTAGGTSAAVVCACGIKRRRPGASGKRDFDLVDAGIRCHENPRVSPEMPALIVASYGGAPTEKTPA